MPDADTVKVLNNLIRTSEDRKNGFAKAAKEATRPELKALFQRRSIDCRIAVVELQRLVESLGGTPKDSGTFAGIAHRVWATVKTVIGDANTAMLEEMEWTEEKAKTAYAKVLTAALPQQIRNTVQLQHYSAIRNHNLIRDLRNCQHATYAYFRSGGLT